MKIAVICANGKAGQLIVKEAMARGADVTAVVRSENKSTATNVIHKDLFDLTTADLESFDIVIDAFGAWTSETLPQHSSSLKHLCDLVSGKSTRLLVVGGAGSLYVNPEHTIQVMDETNFPEIFKPLAAHMGKALDALRTRTPSASFKLSVISYCSVNKSVPRLEIGFRQCIFLINRSSLLQSRICLHISPRPAQASAQALLDSSGYFTCFSSNSRMNFTSASTPSTGIAL